MQIGELWTAGWCADCAPVLVLSKAAKEQGREAWVAASPRLQAAVRLAGVPLPAHEPLYFSCVQRPQFVPSTSPQLPPLLPLLLPCPFPFCRPASSPTPSHPPVLGFTDKDDTYLPPYYWFADSAAAHLIEVVNKYYAGTGFSFYIPKVSGGQQNRLRCRHRPNPAAQ